MATDWVPNSSQGLPTQRLATVVRLVARPTCGDGGEPGRSHAPASSKELDRA